MLRTSKAEEMRRFALGHYGNSVRQWPDVASVRADWYQGRVVVRSHRASWPGCRYGLTIDEADSYIQSLVAEGESAGVLYLNEYLECQPHKITIQGEVFRGPEGLTLHYAKDPVMMREAMKRGKDSLATAYRTEAQLLLQQNLDPSSYDALMDLLDEEGPENHGYPTSHVVEFTAFGCNVGSTPGRNCLIWETRAY